MTTDNIPTEDEIKTLLKSSYYSPSTQSKLESYLDGQIENARPYNFDANRTLLKLYQFFPQNSPSYDSIEEKTAFILMLALLQYPRSTDILALSCLVPDKIQNVEPTCSILKCAELLDSCQFHEFWNLFISNIPTSLKKSSSNIDTDLQTAILKVLALSYRVAPMSVVAQALNIPDFNKSSIKPFSDIIESADDAYVTFKATSDNTKRSRVYQDVDFSSITSLMTKIARE